MDRQGCAPEPGSRRCTKRVNDAAGWRRLWLLWFAGELNTYLHPPYPALGPGRCGGSAPAGAGLPDVPLARRRQNKRGTVRAPDAALAPCLADRCRANPMQQNGKHLRQCDQGVACVVGVHHASRFRAHQQCRRAGTARHSAKAQDLRTHPIQAWRCGTTCTRPCSRGSTRPRIRAWCRSQYRAGEPRGRLTSAIRGAGLLGWQGCGVRTSETCRWPAGRFHQAPCTSGAYRRELCPSPADTADLVHATYTLILNAHWN